MEFSWYQLAHRIIYATRTNPFIKQCPLMIQGYSVKLIGFANLRAEADNDNDAK